MIELIFIDKTPEWPSEVFCGRRMDNLGLAHVVEPFLKDLALNDFYGVLKLPEFVDNEMKLRYYKT